MPQKPAKNPKEKHKNTYNLHRPKSCKNEHYLLSCHRVMSSYSKLISTIIITTIGICSFIFIYFIYQLQYDVPAPQTSISIMQPKSFLNQLQQKHSRIYNNQNHGSGSMHKFKFFKNMMFDNESFIIEDEEISIKKLNNWKKTQPFDNTYFILDNVSMYENESEILTPTHLNFTILKKRYNNFISSMSPIKDKDNDINPNQIRCQHKGKVFVIGINKSGTTSLNRALLLLGFDHNNTFTHWYRSYHHFHPKRYNGRFFYFRHFYDKMNVIFMNKYLINRIKKESFYSYNFGDSPWCFLYELFDIWYPNSKFILMKRNSTWNIVDSQMKYMKDVIDGSFINVRELNDYNWDGLNGYNLANWIAMRYELHNERVLNYFQNRINKDLLILNLEKVIFENIENKKIGHQIIWKKMMKFLGCNDDDNFSENKKFPHSNKNQIKTHILPDNYELNWKRYFKYKIPLLYRASPLNTSIDQDIHIKLLDEDILHLI